MKLENSFTIDAPVEKAWQALNSPETVAPCFPGATLTSYEGDSFTGTVKVKLGPIAMTYKGKGTYVTRDDDAHEVVIKADGRDSRGNGTASATVTASLAADGPDRTSVSMETDMTVTGKPAQFGRGVISDVADKIIKQFSACVARKLTEEPAAPAATEPVVEEPVVEEAAVRVVAAPASEAVSDIPSSAAAAERSTPVPAGGSEAIPDAVAERVTGSSGTGSSGTGSNGATSNGSRPDETPPAPITPATTAAPVSPASAPAAAAPLTPATTAVPAAAPPSQAAPSQASPSQTPVRSEVDAIDLLDTAGAPVLRRLAPVAGGSLLLLLVILLVRRLRSV